MRCLLDHTWLDSCATSAIQTASVFALNPSNAAAFRSSWSPSTIIRAGILTTPGFISTAGLGAVLHIGPVLGPAPPPTHGQAAGLTGLARQCRLVASKRWGACRHGKRSFPASLSCRLKPFLFDGHEPPPGGSLSRPASRFQSPLRHQKHGDAAVAMPLHSGCPTTQG